jgi:hypothetical protein
LSERLFAAEARIAELEGALAPFEHVATRQDFAELFVCEDWLAIKDHYPEFAAFLTKEASDADHG